MKRYIILAIVVSTLSIAGCQNSLPVTTPSAVTQQILPAQRTVTPLVEATSTQRPLQMSTNTSVPTAPPSTETPSPASGPTYPPETRLQVKCLEILPEIPDGTVSHGVVVLGRLSATPRYYDTIFLDMATGITTTLSVAEEAQLYHVVSLDRSLLAYVRDTYENGQIEKTSLVIATSDGQVQKEIPWEKEWYYPLMWTNNQRLLLAYTNNNLRDKEGWNVPIAYLVLDPFTGERKLFPPIFPNFVDGNGPPYWDGWQGVMYDPTLTRVVYPQTVSTPSDAYTYTYALWDTSAQSLVTDLEGTYSGLKFESTISPKPVWSDDGSRFVFLGYDYWHDHDSGFEIYQVSRDGQIEQLTNLYPFVHFNDLPMIWAPDSRSIAMLWWGGLRGDIVDVYGGDLLVLNLETKEVTDTCLSVRGSRKVADGEPRLIWSPDGKQILLRDWIDDFHSRIVLVDIEQGFAVQIAENVELLGWMVAPEK